MPKKSNRPVEYDPVAVETILDRLAEGRGLQNLCRSDPRLPWARTFRKWMEERPELRQRYRDAREVQAHTLADQVVEISDTDRDPQRARNRMQARQWFAAKVNPASYGDKVEIAGTIEHTIEAPSPLEAARRLAFLLECGRREQLALDGQKLPDIEDATEVPALPGTVEPVEAEPERRVGYMEAECAVSERISARREEAEARRMTDPQLTVVKRRPR